MLQTAYPLLLIVTCWSKLCYCQEMPQEQPQPGKHRLSPGPDKGIANPQGRNKMHLLSPTLKTSEKMSSERRRFLSISLLPFSSSNHCLFLWLGS